MEQEYPDIKTIDLTPTTLEMALRLEPHNMLVVGSSLAGREESSSDDDTEEYLSGQIDEVGEANESYHACYPETHDHDEFSKHHTISSFKKKQWNPAISVCSHAISLCHEVNLQKATYLYQKDKPKSGSLFNDQWMLIYPPILELIRNFLVNSKQIKSPIAYRCEQYDAVLAAFDKVLRPYQDCIYDLIAYPYDQLNEIDANGVPTGQKISVAMLINFFIKTLFEYLHSTKYIQRVNDRRKVARRREKKVLRYINKLRKHYSRLIGVRVDLYLPDDKKNFTPKEIVSNFHTLMQKLRRRESVHLAGYVTKLEYGVDQALHIHCFFFFNGSHHREDISLGRMIGEMWDQQIDGNHSYFNCNTSKNRKKYKYDALGVINRNDQSKYDNIAKVIHYFAKFEQYVLHSSLERIKTLNTGIVPHLRREMGRPNLSQYYKSI
ncbi:inovirus Gp2 family protein [Acinetobacter junii]|uniref:YagK/YfjJ domain-containing protein n=1 Tax=Acinetobacter TaxID=469 RepID=UPI001FD6A9C7|nr:MULTISPECIES: inovirus-type Gp2 protein [Acinetobacter]MDH1859067.1 inovirus Gp2 family protein [Acinetobacter junii]